MNDHKTSKINVRLYPSSGEIEAVPLVTTIQLVGESETPLPIQDTDTLWRYVTLAKLIDMLSNNVLWFSYFTPEIK